MTTVGIDKLARYMMQSVIKELLSYLTSAGFSGAWIAGPDFDHDTKSDGNPRTLPYIYMYEASHDFPPTYVGDDKREYLQEFIVGVACENFDKLLDRPKQVKQLFITMETDNTPNSFKLWDFDNSPETDAGRFEVEPGAIMPEIQLDKSRWRNLKYTAEFRVMAYVDKSKDAKLI